MAAVVSKGTVMGTMRAPSSKTTCVRWRAQLQIRKPAKELAFTLMMQKPRCIACNTLPSHSPQNTPLPPTRQQ